LPWSPAGTRGSGSRCAGSCPPAASPSFWQPGTRRGARPPRRSSESRVVAGVIFHQLDVTDASSIARLAEFLKARFGRLDILVNNAAIGGIELVDDPSFGPKPVGEQIR